MIGYWLAQALLNEGVSKSVLCLVTQTVVDAHDPAFAQPTKFIGRGYPEPEAAGLRARFGWRFAADGEKLRRVVASPEPLRLVEQASVDTLLDGGSVVIAGGGGGAVVTATDGELTGAEAVVDKDLLSAMLAIRVHADRLLIFTDVAAVMENFGTPDARPIRSLTPEELGGREFPAGSMAPKVEACRRFVVATGREATIGALSDAAHVLGGTAGTTIRPGRS